MDAYKANYPQEQEYEFTRKGEVARLRAALREIMEEYKKHDAAGIDVMFQIASDAINQ